MSGGADDWSAFEAAWRARSKPAPRGLEELKARVRRERIRMRLEAALEAAVTVACACLFLGWARDAHGAARVILMTLAVASLVILAIVGGLRRATWRARGDSVAAYRGLLRRQARLTLIFSRLGYVGAPSGFALGVALAHFGDLRAGVEDRSAWTVIMLLALAALAASWIWSIREAGRCRRVLAELAQREEGLDD